MLAPESTSNVVGKPLSRRDILALFLLISGWEACRVKISSSLLSRETYCANSTGAVSPGVTHSFRHYVPGAPGCFGMPWRSDFSFRNDYMSCLGLTRSPATLP